MNGQPTNSAKVTVCRYLEQHADAEQLSVNQLWDRLQHEGIQVGRTTVAQALKEQKQRIES
jgi:Fe2+ or Zn2+ uptake regulation protein